MAIYLVEETPSTRTELKATDVSCGAEYESIIYCALQWKTQLPYVSSETRLCRLIWNVAWERHNIWCCEFQCYPAVVMNLFSFGRVRERCSFLWWLFFCFFLHFELFLAILPAWLYERDCPPHWFRQEYPRVGSDCKPVVIRNVIDWIVKEWGRLWLSGSSGSSSD